MANARGRELRRPSPSRRARDTNTPVRARHRINLRCHQSFCGRVALIVMVSGGDGKPETTRRRGDHVERRLATSPSLGLPRHRDGVFSGHQCYRALVCIRRGHQLGMQSRSLRSVSAPDPWTIADCELVVLSRVACADLVITSAALDLRLMRDDPLAPHISLSQLY